VDGADSWALDAHKWLNVPYDSGVAIVADARAHHMSLRTQAAAYLVRDDGERDGSDWVPESSRRARAFAIYAVLRTLGRSGVEAMIDRSCTLARELAARLARMPGVCILNEVVLNQVLVRFAKTGADVSEDEVTRGNVLTLSVIARVQQEGVCWLGPSRYQGRAVMRVSLSNWSTTERDIELSAESIERSLQACLAAI
jgi:glutamate/tyrosine decarboxylase-like PLP-dependent enzyme